jgi:GNAT superfamily N-acetyltransferase
VVEVLTERWGAPVIVSRGRTHDASALPAVVAEVGGERLGLATYRVEGGDAEVVSMDSLVAGRGIGTALVAAVTEAAVSSGCGRLWLITTNDNLNALRFYQRRGLRLVAVHRGAADEGRRLKPQIPTVGDSAIPVHDEIELELRLDRS